MGRKSVAAKGIGEDWGTYDFFRKFDNARESDICEPYYFSNKIHGYDQSAGKRVLDVGCGNGYVLYHYAKHGAEVHGIDITETAIKLSRQRFKMCGLDGEFEMTDGNSISYPDGYFDIVCSIGVLHHIPDPRPMISEIYRVLKPGGELILMLYHKNSFRNQVMFRIFKYFASSCRGKSLQEIRNMNDGSDCPLALVYSKREIEKLLKDFSDIKFTVNKLAYRELFIIRRIGNMVEHLLPSPCESFFARHWGWNLYIKARKV